MGSVPRRPNVLKSAQRALAILEVVETSLRGKQLAEVSAELGMNKATALRILRTLVAERILQHDDATGRYSSDPGSWTYLMPFLRPALSFLSSVQGTLDRLAESAGATSLVGLPKGAGRMAMAAMHSVPPTVIYYDLTRAPEALLLHSTAAGKCYLAARSEEELAAYLAPGLERATDRTVSSPSALRKELLRVRKRGYAVSRGEALPDMSALAAPLKGAGGAVVGGMTLIFTEGSVAERQALTYLPVLRDAAERVSTMLSYDSWLARVRESETGAHPSSSPWETPDPGFGEGPTPYVRTVARLIRLMAQLLTRPEGMPLTALARARSLDKTTTWRLLCTLEAEDAVWQDAPGRQYRVSPLFWIRRASVLRSGSSLAEMAKSILQELADATGCTAILGLPDRDGRNAISGQAALPHSPICFHPEYDTLLPLHAAASGKCFLSAQSRLAVESYIRRGLTALTEHSITSREQLLRQLNEVCQKGYALSYEEGSRGVGALAVPVVDHAESVVASVTVVPLIHRLTEPNIRQWLPLLRGAADRLSQLLAPGWRAQLVRGGPAGARPAV